MKQHTTPEQTAKLIELGFEKPTNTQYIQRAKARNLHSPFIEFGEPEFEGSNSIGELMEILFGWYFKQKTQSPDDPMIFYSVGLWRGQFAVNVIEDEYVHNKELIDALFDTLVEIKEKGMI